MKKIIIKWFVRMFVDDIIKEIPRNKLPFYSDSYFKDIQLYMTGNGPEKEED